MNKHFIQVVRYPGYVHCGHVHRSLTSAVRCRRLQTRTHPVGVAQDGVTANRYTLRVREG